MQSTRNRQSRPTSRHNYRTSKRSDSLHWSRRAAAKPRIISSSHLSAARIDSQGTIDSFCPYAGLNYGSTSKVQSAPPSITPVSDSVGGNRNGRNSAYSSHSANASGYNNYGSGVFADCGKFVSVTDLDSSQHSVVATDIRIQSKEAIKRSQEIKMTQRLVIGLAAALIAIASVGMLWMQQSNEAARASELVTTGGAAIIHSTGD